MHAQFDATGTDDLPYDTFISCTRVLHEPLHRILVLFLAYLRFTMQHVHISGGTDEETNTRLPQTRVENNLSRERERGGGGGGREKFYFLIFINLKYCNVARERNTFTIITSILIAPFLLFFIFLFVSFSSCVCR